MLAAQMSDYALAKILDAIVAAEFTTVKIGLFTGNPALTAATVLADLTALAPTYTGYLEQTIAPGTVRRDAANDYIQPFATATFQPTAPGGGLPNTITGYYITVTISATEHLWAAEKFDSPVVFVDDFSALDVIYDFYVKNLLQWGGVCATC